MQLVDFSICCFSEPSTFVADSISSNPVDSAQQHAAESFSQSPNLNQAQGILSHQQFHSKYRIEIL